MTALLLVVVPLLASLALGRTGPRAARWLSPPATVRLLTAGALVTALATGFVLGATAFTAMARVPAVAAVGHWSARALAAHDDVPFGAGAAAAITVLALLTVSLRYVASTTADLLTADATCRRLGPGTDGLVVVEDGAPDAYVVPGLHGRVVVSTAMLRALPAPERRALLAHERSHLRHRHHLYIQLTQLGAHANPFLRPLVDVVRTGVERWADEDAAAATGDRRTTARAIARAALAQRDTPGHRRAHPLALAMAASATVLRTRALLDAPTPRRSTPALVLTALAAVGPVAAATCALLTEHYFELAQAAQLARR